MSFLSCSASSTAVSGSSKCDLASSFSFAHKRDRRLLNISNFNSELSESLIAKTRFCQIFKRMIAINGENFLPEFLPKTDVGEFHRTDISTPSNVTNYPTNPSTLEKMSQWIQRNEDENLIHLYGALRRNNIALDADLLAPLADTSPAAINQRAQNIRNWLQAHNDNLLRITRLDLSFSHLTFIPQEINLFRNLNNIDLSYNLIREIPANAFAGLRELTDLSLHNNMIREIHPNAFSGLEKLTVLDLRMNQIRRIPSNVFAELGKLIRLPLQYNFIEEIHPDAFTNLRNLIFLHLQHNNIRRIYPNAFINLGNLRTLELHNNEINDIAPNAFIGLKRLTRLYLHNNKIRHINPSAFAKLVCLQRLHLNYNQITEIGANAFAALVKLIYLNLEHNPIREIHANAFAGLDNLTSILIDEIYLDHLPDMRNLKNNVRDYLLSYIHLTLTRRIMRHFESNINIYNIVSTALSSLAMAWLSVSMLSSES